MSKSRKTKATKKALRKRDAVATNKFLMAIRGKYK
jgi:hypothetical protein